jgi:uncharacterized protein YeaO (DUF488 family)
VKRVYEPAEDGDGFRVLVDRLWPRGLTKEKAGIGLWAKDLAPSNALRKQVHGGEVTPADFAVLYGRELAVPAAAALADMLIARAAGGVVTLLYAAKDEQANNALVLKDWLERRR